MRSITLPLLVLICFEVSCGNHSTGTSDNKKTLTSPATQENTTAAPNQSVRDTTQWINSFRAFRDAVYQRNKEKVKQFIDFPIISDNNNIWYLIYMGVDNKINSLSDSIKPFTEKDFDKYYDSLFTKRFITCILKIKTEELWKNSEVHTKEFKEGTTTYSMYAIHDVEGNKLSLNVASNTVYKTNDGESDNGEFSEIYVFEILSSGKIKFRKVELAG